MTKPVLPKTVRGKRPQFFDNRSIDYVMGITMALAEEVSSMRDRLDLIERVADKKGIILAEEIETHTLDDKALVERETRRQGYVDRLFAVMHQEISEFGEIDSHESYQGLLDEIASAD